ncbi:hypothetical protein RvY_11736 [Ramazzottius varieornatus]|uniref:Uncharacterized protein n=1 Tax=Ramazzottius varieornatus TaxID=947166 RepID=A0A1D1VJH7_RAMVA|nr:hypothetical protein RvY_11736 [Ramazzottius varieornatus]
MIANRPTRFSSRRVQNLTEIPSQNQRKTPKSSLNKVSPAPKALAYDSDEDDAELKALREAALASRKSTSTISPEVRKPAPAPVTSGPAPIKPAIRNKPINGVTKDARDQSAKQSQEVQRERPEQAQPRQERTNYPSRQSNQHSQSSTPKTQPESKYGEMDLEDLRQQYHASKRSRFARRNDSDNSSSEDDDYEYLKHARRDRNDQQQSSVQSSVRSGVSNGSAESDSSPAQSSGTRLNRQNSRKDVASSSADRERKSKAETSMSDTTSVNGSTSSSPVELHKSTPTVEVPKSGIAASKWIPVPTYPVESSSSTVVEKRRSGVASGNSAVEVDPMERRRLKFATFEDRTKLLSTTNPSLSSTKDMDVMEN